MRNLVVILFLCLNANKAIAQKPTFDPVAKKQLDAVYVKDWQYRKYIINMTVQRRDSLARAFRIRAEDVEQHLQSLQAANDSENIRIIAKIIWNNESDYPGKSLVGEPTHLAAWSVILHSNQKQKYFPRVSQAYTMGELPETAVATLNDYILVEKGGLQHYGTHFTPVPTLDTPSGKIITKYYISPTESPDDVNSLRKAAGFANTVEEYAASLGVIYEKYLTLARLEKMRNEARKKR